MFVYIFPYLLQPRYMSSYDIFLDIEDLNLQTSGTAMSEF